ncbi:hypothetical protein ACIQM4_17480 [Streptomyces sp. NPDC091272]|uniref:hypothetical protein n=1 Tax=Streptomyces sp. NPDC091272 TaxID=3365981 RepID=UPI00380DFB96
MAWDEWEQLKTEAAEQRTQLNQVPAESGGGGGAADLVVRDDELGELGNMAHALRERLRVEADFARPSTFTASVDLFNDGLDMGSALTELVEAWNDQTSTLKEACAHISNHLDFTRALHSQDEAKVVTGMTNAAGEPMTVPRIDSYLK